MSYLMRNGTGRNNIVYGGSISTSANYLRRTGTSINSISWYTISSNGTYNILERYSTSRNSIRWNNIVFSFGGDLTKIRPLMSYLLDTNYGTWAIFSSGTNGQPTQIYGYHPNTIYATKNVLSWASMNGGRLGTLNSTFTTYYFGLCATTNDNANTIADELMKFSKLQTGSSSVNIVKNKRVWSYLYTFDSNGRLIPGYIGLIQISGPILLSSDSITFS